MAEDKKTQLGQPMRTNQPTPAPVDSGDNQPRTSYLPAQPADPLLSTTLAGRYVIERKLGEGGMGAVYLATHKLLEKHVALKILHGEFARKQDLVERFMQEAKSASRIRHENVIDISDFGATPEGLVFFAMELLTGHDLHDEIARARVSGHLLPWARTKKIFLQICAALTAAHAKGIVHRDLKPENVYLVEFLGDPDFVKLLDFGIAKMTDAAEDGGRKLTKTGMLFGTPEYMSPEQARGENVDHRVDVYAMGCILFQLVTNRVPFEADNFMGVLSMHLTEAPPSIPPEVFDQIGAPRELASVIDRALEKDRAQRYQTIDELARAVRAACGDASPTGPGPVVPSVPSPASTTTRRVATPPPNATPVPAVTSGRVRTQWTGNLSVPHEAGDAPARRRSKLPFAIAGAAVVAGGAVAAALAFGGGTTPAPALVAPGSAAIGSGVSATVPIPPPPVPPTPQPVPAPAMVKLVLDTTPEGATVVDLSNGKPVGKTPVTLSMPGAHATRQFSFRLRGYGDAIAELPLDRETFAFKTPLTKGAATSVVRKVDDPAIKPIDTSTAVTKPAQTDPVTKPETKPAQAPGSDDVMPTLKDFGSGK